MESIIVACITRAVILVGVILSNSKNGAVMEIKIDVLMEKVEKRNRLIERTYNLGEFTHAITALCGGGIGCFAGGEIKGIDVVLGNRIWSGFCIWGLCRGSWAGAVRKLRKGFDIKIGIEITDEMFGQMTEEWESGNGEGPLFASTTLLQ